MSDSVRLHRRQPMSLPRPWDSPGKNTGVGCHFLLQCMKVRSGSEVAQSCLTLSDPMDCGPPGSSIHGIFQARVLEWGAIAFSVNWNYHIVNQLHLYKIKSLKFGKRKKCRQQQPQLLHNKHSEFQKAKQLWGNILLYIYPQNTLQVSQVGLSTV